MKKSDKELFEILGFNHGYFEPEQEMLDERIIAIQSHPSYAIGLKKGEMQRLIDRENIILSPEELEERGQKVKNLFDREADKEDEEPFKTLGFNYGYFKQGQEGLPSKHFLAIRQHPAYVLGAKLGALQRFTDKEEISQQKLQERGKKLQEIIDKEQDREELER